MSNNTSHHKIWDIIKYGGMAMSKKILMIAGDFVEDYELMVPFQALQICGFQVDVVSPEKQAGELIRTAIHDFEGDQTYSEKRGHNFHLNADFQSAEEADYDALLLPGGRSPEYLRLNKKVIALIQAFAKAGKPIAAICHGPQLLTAADVIRGKKISAYSACEPEVLAAGAEFVALPLEGAVTDGQFVTGPAWTAHVEWLKQFIALLNS